jgi:hypothetical protein
MVTRTIVEGKEAIHLNLPTQKCDGHLAGLEVLMHLATLGLLT